MPGIAFPTGYFENLCLLLRKAGARKINRTDLHSRIEAVLLATGVADDGSEYAKAFNEAKKGLSDDAKLAREFSAIARAQNPLSPTICKRQHRSRLSARARGLREFKSDRSLLTTSWEELNRDQQREVKKLARSLAEYHRSQVSRGAGVKTAQNALLVELADIYVSIARLVTLDRYELPHAVRSNFISFCHTALRPFFGATEVTFKALSNRWKSIKEHELSGIPSDLTAAERLMAAPNRKRH